MIWMRLLALLFPVLAFSQPTQTLSRPEQDFETFWATFRDHYAFFEMKGVDWDSVYRQYRPLVNRRTKTKDLIALLGRMVDPLQDGHITISKGEEIIYKYRRPSYFKTEFKDLEKEFWGVVQTHLQEDGFAELRGVGPVERETPLYYATRSKTLGYVRITRCFSELESLFADELEKPDILTMVSHLDSILNAWDDVQGMVIDVRGNGGGHGGEVLAERFSPARRLTHYKAIREKGGPESFGPPIPFYVESFCGFRFYGPLTILMNDRTASSAEDFVLSLYAWPHITTVGSNSAGMLSDMYGADLSGGYAFSLSNQRYYDTDMRVLEGVGVPAELPVQHRKEDLATRRVLAAALGHLRGQSGR
jgi:carboxyl-terminal processing protease